MCAAEGQGTRHGARHRSSGGLANLPGRAGSGPGGVRPGVPRWAAPMRANGVDLVPFAKRSAMLGSRARASWCSASLGAALTGVLVLAPVRVLGAGPGPRSSPGPGPGPSPRPGPGPGADPSPETGSDPGPTAPGPTPGAIRPSRPRSARRRRPDPRPDRGSVEGRPTGGRQEAREALHRRVAAQARRRRQRERTRLRHGPHGGAGGRCRQVKRRSTSGRAARPAELRRRGQGHAPPQAHYQGAAAAPGQANRAADAPPRPASWTGPATGRWGPRTRSRCVAGVGHEEDGMRPNRQPTQGG
jgi:hypothetical protein